LVEARREWVTDPIALTDIADVTVETRRGGEGVAVFIVVVRLTDGRSAQVAGASINPSVAEDVAERLSVTKSATDTPGDTDTDSPPADSASRRRTKTWAVLAALLLPALLVGVLDALLDSNGTDGARVDVPTGAQINERIKELRESLDLNMFVPGLYQVDVDMPSGAYHAGDGCTWSKLSSRESASVYESGIGPGDVVVDSAWFEIAAKPGNRGCLVTKR
jgi:hypothetical protein